MKPVTDPALLAQLEGQFAQRQAPPEVAVQLNAQLAEQAFEQEAAKGEQWELSEEATATPTLDAIEGGAQDFKTGLASSGVKTALGLKQLFGAEGDLDATMQQLVDEDMDETGMWGTVGSVVGDLGQMAVPGAAVARAGRAVTAGGRLAQAARAATSPLGADVVASAALAGTRRAEEGESRLGNALRDAALAGGTGAVVGKFAKGLNRSDAARELMAEGAYLTPGMASDHKTVGLLEELMHVTPFLGRRTDELRTRAGQSLQRIAINRARPPGATDEIVELGHDGFRQLSQMYKDAYADAWAGAGPGNAGAAFMRGAQGTSKLAKKSHRRVVNALLEDIANAAGDAHKVDTVIRDRLSALTPPKDNELIDLLQDMRKSFRNTLDGDTVAKLAAVDSQYGAYKAIQRVIGRTAETGGEFTPTQLIRASRGVTKSPEVSALGEAPMMGYAQLAEEVSPEKVPGVLNVLRRMVSLLPSPVPLESIGRRLTGEGAEQVALRRAAEAQVLRGARPGRLAAALSED